MSASLTIFNDNQMYPAFIRDCGWAGIFFYSAWTPRLASDVEFALEARQVRVQCSGRVVRVERATSGGVTGVAILLERSEVVRKPPQAILETPAACG
jgi:hypothetical protein